ncbi:MAG: BMP family protein [Anaerolineaceae bacterium]|nr:BMP family protein [Anaerolineaceae bacterium]
MTKRLSFLTGIVSIGLILRTGCGGIRASATATQHVAAPTVTAHESNFRLAAIFPGVVTDADFNTLGYIGINEVQRKLDIETVYEEKVDAAMAYDIIRKYIADDYNIIWTHGGQFVTITADIAHYFPDVFFIAEGDEPLVNPPANLWFIDRNFQLGYYLIGTTAALSTRTGKIGYLGGERMAYSYAEVHAIEQAIRDLGLEESVELKAVWVGDFNDPLMARELADGLIADNVDFIMGSLNLGMFGAFEAVKNASGRQVLITARFIDKSDFAPDHYVTSLLYDFSAPLMDIIQRIMAGESGGYYPLSFITGESLQFPFSNVDPLIEEQVSQLLEMIIAGNIQVVKDTRPIP